MIKLIDLIKELEQNKHFYHITLKKNVPSIMKRGILPYPEKSVRFEEKAVYLFDDKTTAEDAIMNWLGDKFPENEPLVLITINPIGLKIFSSDVGYEYRTFDIIDPKHIVSIEDVG